MNFCWSSHERSSFFKYSKKRPYIVNNYLFSYLVLLLPIPLVSLILQDLQSATLVLLSLEWVLSLLLPLSLRYHSNLTESVSTGWCAYSPLMSIQPDHIYYVNACVQVNMGVYAIHWRPWASMCTVLKRLAFRTPPLLSDWHSHLTFFVKYHFHLSGDFETAASSIACFGVAISKMLEATLLDWIPVDFQSLNKI